MWGDGGPHEIPSRAACGPRVGQHCFRHYAQTYNARNTTLQSTNE